MNFMKDCLEAFVLGSCLDMFGMDALDGCPTKIHIPLFLNASPPEEQYKWLKQLGEELLQKYVKLNEGEKKWNTQYQVSFFNYLLPSLLKFSS